MEKVAVTFRVYGNYGHRQKHSFSPSYTWDFSRGNDVRIIEVRNADLTGTHNYSEVVITRNSKEECFDEISGQISDGIFENCRCGYFETIETV